jgi:hypothetical protein
VQASFTFKTRLLCKAAYQLCVHLLVVLLHLIPRAATPYGEMKESTAVVSTPLREIGQKPTVLLDAMPTTLRYVQKNYWFSLAHFGIQTMNIGGKKIGFCSRCELSRRRPRKGMTVNHMTGRQV